MVNIESVLPWLQHGHNDGCRYHRIAKPETKGPPAGKQWEADDNPGVSPAEAASGLCDPKAPRNYACVMGPNTWAIDLDCEDAVKEFDEAMGDAKTLSTTTPRGGLHLLFKGTMPQPGGIDHYLDVRGSLKGYLLAAGSRLALAAYVPPKAGKWKDATYDARLEEGKRRAPAGDAPWFYAPRDVVPMIEAPQAVLDLLERKLAEDKARRLEAAKAKADAKKQEADRKRAAKRQAAGEDKLNKAYPKPTGEVLESALMAIPVAADDRIGSAPITREEWITALSMRPRSDGDYCSGCPSCGDGDSASRLRVKPDGKIFCRQCCPDGSDVDSLRAIEAAAFPGRDTGPGRLFRFIAATHNASGGSEAGKRIAEKWASQSQSFERAEFDRTWLGVKGHGGCTFGTIVFEARQHGWKPPRREGGGGMSDAAKAHAADEDDTVSVLPLAPLAGKKKRQHVGHIVIAIPIESWVYDAAKLMLRAAMMRSSGALYETTLRDVGESPDNGVSNIVSVSRWADGTPMIEPMSEEDLLMFLNRVIEWYRIVKKKVAGEWIEEEVRTDLTKAESRAVVAAYREIRRRSGGRLRLLRSVLQAPTLRTDGSLIANRGYDKSAEVYLDIEPKDWSTLPASPTKADAVAAYQTLVDLVRETAFTADLDRAVWVSMILTLVGRHYVGGNVPLYAFNGTQASAGKSSSAKLAGAIALGRIVAAAPPVAAARRGDMEEEESKRLFSMALSGKPFLLIDNQESSTEFGSQALDMTLTSGTDGTPGFVSNRTLGRSKIVEVDFTSLVCVTGNNLALIGDLHRRTVFCQFGDPTEVLKDRQYSIDDLEQHALMNRKKLLGCALTILLAHTAALKAKETGALLPSIPSFGGWSRCIRSAVHWIAGIDIWKETRNAVGDADVDAVLWRDFCEEWYRWKQEPVTVAAMQDAVMPSEKDDPSSIDRPALLAAMKELPVDVFNAGGKTLNTRRLGRELRKVKERIDVTAPYVIRQMPKAQGYTRWQVDLIGDKVRVPTEDERKPEPGDDLGSWSADDEQDAVEAQVAAEARAADEDFGKTFSKHYPKDGGEEVEDSIPCQEPGCTNDAVLPSMYCKRHKFLDK